MMPASVHTTPTQRVVARLCSEGWVYCSDLGFPALIQQPIPNLSRFVLAQLRAANGWMELVDLQLAALIFSIPAHEFQFHPDLPSTLEQLEAEGRIEIRETLQRGGQHQKRAVAIALVSDRIKF